MKRASLLCSIGILIGSSIAYVQVQARPNRENPVHEATEWAQHARTRKKQASVRLKESASVRTAAESSDTKTQLKSKPNPEPEPESPLLPLVNTPDIYPEDQQLISEVLTWLPPACRETVEQIVVRYDDDAQRGLSSSSVIILRGIKMGNAEKAAVLIHECGHIIDLGALRGSEKSGESSYPDGLDPAYEDDPSVLFYSLSWKNTKARRSGSMRGDFASGYAMTDPWEDVAETFIARVLHKDAIYALAEQSAILKAKIAIIEQYYLPADFAYVPNPNPRPSPIWDWTKEAHGLLDVL